MDWLSSEDLELEWFKLKNCIFRLLRRFFDFLVLPSPFLLRSLKSEFRRVTYYVFGVWGFVGSVDKGFTLFLLVLIWFVLSAWFTSSMDISSTLLSFNAAVTAVFGFLNQSVNNHSFYVFIKLMTFQWAIIQRFVK